MLTTVKPPALAVHLPPALDLTGLPSREDGSDRGDNDLTNLAWLQKPGVLNSMCTALTGSPHRVSRAGTRSTKKPRERTVRNEPGAAAGGNQRESDKMVNVILNVRANRKYNGEDELKPPLSFACMIFMAIESSPTKTLPVKEIYDWIQWKFPFYRTAAPGWKNSVRHNLSLNKCFKKVDRGWSKSKSPLSKGGLWTVDPEYRRNLLSALRSSPYHPYHSYFTPPLSPSSSDGSLDSLEPAERDAALTMCMISGGPEDSLTLAPGLLHGVYHDHCYAKRPPSFTVRIPRQRRGLSLAEVAAAAELILQQEDKEEMECESSDEGIGGEEESDDEGEEMECEGTAGDRSLADSGYGGADTPPSLDSRCSSMEELGADALLCLAGKRQLQSSS